VTAEDFAGNTDSDSITFSINPEKTEKKKEGGFLGMPGFDGTIFVIALIFVFLLTGHRKRISRSK